MRVMERCPSSIAAGVRGFGSSLIGAFNNVYENRGSSVACLEIVCGFYVVSHGQCLNQSKYIFNVIYFDPLVPGRSELLCGYLGCPKGVPEVAVGTQEDRWWGSWETEALSSLPQPRCHGCPDTLVCIPSGPAALPPPLFSSLRPAMRPPWSLESFRGWVSQW